MHSGYIWPKPTKNKMWFHEFFPSKFQQIHIISVFRVPIDPILPKIRSFDVISRVVLFGSNLPKIRSFDRISRVLTSKFQQIYIISVSGVLFGPNSPKKKILWCDFTIFLQASFSWFTLFPFPVIACASYQKFVKLLLAQLWSVNFPNFWGDQIFGGVLTLGPLCAALMPLQPARPSVHCTLLCRLIMTSDVRTIIQWFDF